MNLTEQGKLIAKLRKEAGYTQKSLAEELNITDKAVSKWERGVCLPDATLFSKLSMILDIDIEYLLSGNTPYGKHEWNGLLVANDLKHEIAGKPLIHYLLSYFMLIGINSIYVKTDDNDYVRSLHLEQYGLDISFGVPYLKNTMVVYDKFFLFGVNLTRQFESCLSSNKDTVMSISKQTIPILFVKNASANYEYNMKNAEIKRLGRGYYYMPLHNKIEIQDVESIVSIYEKYHNKKIADLLEIARVRRIIEK